MSTEIELHITKGPLAGKRFPVTKAGLRLGRSSSCEIAIKDPALSRNHCLFEVRDAGLWVSDLASANGTYVNGREIGADSCRLQPGDQVSVGETVLEIPSAEGKPSAPAVDTVDLGLGASAESAPAEDRDDAAHSPVLRIALWTIALVLVCGAAWLMLAPPAAPAPVVTVEAVRTPATSLIAFRYEKVEADVKGIFRHALAYSPAAGLAAEIDDTRENRHVRKAKPLTPAAVTRLMKVFTEPAFLALERDYTGVQGGQYRSFRFKVILNTRVVEVTVENTQEPEAFRAVREQVETFAKNELGIWALQYSSDKLRELSEAAYRAGKLKWDERDVQFGNLAAAIRQYDEAIADIETINPKPAYFDDLLARNREAKAELDKRYRDQNFLVDRAIKLGEWETARRELRTLCDLVPDARDARHGEANAKLLDVEARQKKGAAK